MCVVRDSDVVGIAIVYNGMNTRYFAATNAINRNYVGCNVVCTAYRAVGSGKYSFFLTVFAVKIPDDAFRKSDSRAAGCIEFVNMMGFLDFYIV